MSVARSMTSCSGSAAWAVPEEGTASMVARTAAMMTPAPVVLGRCRTEVSMGRWRRGEPVSTSRRVTGVAPVRRRSGSGFRTHSASAFGERTADGRGACAEPLDALSNRFEEASTGESGQQYPRHTSRRPHRQCRPAGNRAFPARRRRPLTRLSPAPEPPVACCRAGTRPGGPGLAPHSTHISGPLREIRHEALTPVRVAPTFTSREPVRRSRSAGSRSLESSNRFGRSQQGVP